MVACCFCGKCILNFTCRQTLGIGQWCYRMEETRESNVSFDGRRWDKQKFQVWKKSLLTRSAVLQRVASNFAQVSNHYRTKINFSSSLDQPAERSQKKIYSCFWTVGNLCVDVPTVRLCYGTGEKPTSMCKQGILFLHFRCKQLFLGSAIYIS